MPHGRSICTQIGRYPAFCTSLVFAVEAHPRFYTDEDDVAEQWRRQASRHRYPRSQTLTKTLSSLPNTPTGQETETPPPPRLPHLHRPRPDGAP